MPVDNPLAESTKRHSEPRWLLGMVIAFAIVVGLLLLFYVDILAFLS